MSQVTNFVLTCHLADRAVASRVVLDRSPDTGEERTLADVTEVASDLSRGKRLTVVVLAAAVNYADLPAILAAVERAPWRCPESVLLLARGEGEVRPAVYGFAGAAHFGQVGEPRRFVALLEAVPS